MSERTPSGAKPPADPKKPSATPATPSSESTSVGSRDQIEQTLDDALAESFPASDPVSIVTSQHEEAWQKKDEDAGNGKPQPDRPRR